MSPSVTNFLFLSLRYDNILLIAIQVITRNKLSDTLKTISLEMRGQFYYLASQFLIAVVPNKVTVVNP